ncbi:MAG: pyruvate formate lyase-activating protein [Anaerolineae bacterium]|nr:pyruvate formate lyase-activating protein [Anaerolineae bacterium]
MKILTVDIGTGTQDIFLFDSLLGVENGYKLILPSPTMMVRRRIQQATQRGQPVLLSGVIMGGGPSQWAAEDHLRAALPLYATPDAARSFNDDLDAVRASGVTVISEDEAARLPSSVVHIEMKDFDFAAIAAAFELFGISLSDLAAAAVAVFDHGNSPPDYSDRQFRFDYLDRQIRTSNRLSAFAFLSNDIPADMTRLQAVARSAGALDFPLVVMDTAPAAVLGATFDPRIRTRQRVMIANVGNFHTLAFRLGPTGIEGLFEHHTGFLDCAKLDRLLISLADGSLTHAHVFGDQGHGALIYHDQPLGFPADDYGVAVTGPRRSLMADSALRPYFAAPFGDMMITGCFGLLAATADLIPSLYEHICPALTSPHANQRAPWDAD